MSSRMGREHARLIKPTRNHAPTEYNLRYKRWTTKKGKNVKSGPRCLTSKPRQQEIPNPTAQAYLRQTKDETPGNHSFLTRFASDDLVENTNNDDLTAALQTSSMQLHVRPYTANPRQAFLEDVNESDNKRSRSFQMKYQLPKAYAHRKIKSAPWKNAPSTPKNAWMTYEEEEKYQALLQDDISHKLQYLSMYKDGSRNSPSLVNEKTGKSYDEEKFIHKHSKSYNISKSRPHTTSSRALNQSLTGMGSYESFPDDSKRAFATESESEWLYHFPEDDPRTPRLKPGVKTQPKHQKSDLTKKKKMTLKDGIDEETLRKIYTKATDDELRKLNRTFKGILSSTIGRERFAKKQFTSGKCDLPANISEEPLTKEDFLKIRLAAFKASQRPAGATHKEAWITSYSRDFGRKWSKREFENATAKIPTLEDDKDSDVKEHFRSKEFVEMVNSKNKLTKDTDENEKDDDKKKSSDETSLDAATPPQENAATVEITESEQSNKTKGAEKSKDYKDRVLKEANEIEEREFKSKFNDDGKQKMQFETTSAQTYKGVPCNKPEEPVWADKTVVSLGSGHWNMLWDHYDGWELQGDAAKNVCDKIPKKDERRKYKIKVYDQGEPCSPKQTVDKSSIMGKYGGEGIERKTNVNYMTEYMRRFTRMPLPRKRVRI